MKKQISQFKPLKGISGEVLRVIKLNIRIGNFVLKDQFMWDVNSTLNSPESFAYSLVVELGLGSEFLLPISHAIREEIRKHRVSLQAELPYIERGEDRYSSHKAGVYTAPMAIPLDMAEAIGKGDPQAIFRTSQSSGGSMFAYTTYALKNKTRRHSLQLPSV